jgi:cyanophycinase
VVLVDHEGSGERFLPEYLEAVGGGACCDVEPVFVRPEQTLDPEPFSDVDGFVVAGGPTPAYLTGLRDAAGVIRRSVRSGVPYLGFSAGAMVAATDAVAGGYRLGRTEVCPEEWSEGLGAVVLGPGLGLVPFTVDAHAAQAGTLGRAVALVGHGLVARAVAIDEDTCLAVATSTQPEQGRVSGSGSVWNVTPAPDGGRGVVVRRSAADR